VDFHLVRTQRLLAGALARQDIEALGNLYKQVPLFHRLASNSAFDMPLSAFFSSGLNPTAPAQALDGLKQARQYHRVVPSAT